MKARTRAALLATTFLASAAAASPRPASAPIVVAEFDLDKAAHDAIQEAAPPVDASPPLPSAGIDLKTPEKSDAAPASAPAATATPAKPGIAAADNITIETGKSSIRIPHIEIAGSSLTGADVVALFALRDAKAIEARLRTLDATAIDMPELILDGIDGKSKTHGSLRQIHLADVKAGRAVSARVASATLVLTDETGTTKVTTSAMAFDGLALAQFAHLAASPRTTEREMLVPLFDAMAVSAITIGDDKAGGSGSVATLRAETLKARPFVQRAKKPTKDDEDLATFSDFVSSFSFEGVEVDGVNLGPAASAHLKRGALDHVAFRRFGEGKLARFEMNGLAIDGDDDKPGHIALANAKVDGIGGEPKAPGADRMELSGYAMDIPADDMGKGARVKGTIARAVYEAEGLVIGKLPPKAVLTIDHAVFQVPPEASGAAVLQAMGYTTLDLSTRIVSRYDAGARTMSLDPFTLTGADMGTLDLRLDLTHVSPDIVSHDDAAQKAAAAAVQVKALDVSLRNFGLVDKLIAFKAIGDGLTPVQERQSIGASIDLGPASLGLQDAKKARLVADALHAFVADPKSLHLGIASPTGLGADAMPMLNSPQALLDAVDVHASAND